MNPVPMPMPIEGARRVDRRRRGMTLLEVLAAFMIFSLVFTVLVGSSQNAVRTQGTSFRRLEADEIADSALAELEVELAQRQVPAIEDEEVELDPYTVRVREVPFGGDGSSLADAAGTALEAQGATAAGGLGAASLLATEMPELMPFFRQYAVEVEWQEGNRKMAVRRTALGFDWPAASNVFAALLPAGTTAPGAADATDAPDGSDANGSGNAGADSANSRTRGARPPAQRGGSGRVGDGTKKNTGSAWKNEVLRRKNEQLRKYGN